jgi:hypothetical protein
MWRFSAWSVEMWIFLYVAIIALGWLPIAVAQGIGIVDYSAVQRGNEIAAACHANGRTSIFDYTECVIAASAQISNDYVRLGFTFRLFVVDALLEEIMRNDKTIARPVKDGHLANVRSAFTMVKHYERTLSLSTKDLCLITQLNCDAAERMDHFWEQQLLQPGAKATRRSPR